jgi:hypothetical protein
MDKWVDPRIHLAGFSGKRAQEVRIQGGRLHGLEVYDLRETGERLVYLNEVDGVHSYPILGRLKVRYGDLCRMNAAIAGRAKLTSSDHPEEELEAVRDGRGTPDPDYVWLGVQPHQQAKHYEEDPRLPGLGQGR